MHKPGRRGRKHCAKQRMIDPKVEELGSPVEFMGACHESGQSASRHTLPVPQEQGKANWTECGTTSATRPTSKIARVNLNVYLNHSVSEEVFEALTTLQRHGLLFWEK